MSKRDMAPDSQVGGAGFNNVLLVIGNEEAFSAKLMTYALEVAGIMDYSIMAINLLDASARKKRYLMSDAGSMELDEARSKCAGAAKMFADKAVVSGIQFDSQFHIGKLEPVVKEIYKERKNIDLVLLEPDYLNEDEDGPISIPAFTLPPGSV